jgi:hypothetical protein
MLLIGQPRSDIAMGKLSQHDRCNDVSTHRLVDAAQ